MHEHHSPPPGCPLPRSIQPSFVCECSKRRARWCLSSFFRGQRTSSGVMWLLCAVQGRGGSLEKSLISCRLSSASHQPHSSLEA